jgi:hypothetical protein
VVTVISTDVVEKMRAALSVAEAQAQRAWDSRPTFIDTGWAWIIGADTTTAGAQALAERMQRDAAALRARFVELQASATATDAQGLAFVHDATLAAGGADTVAEVTALVSPGGALREVGGATLRDVGAKLSPLVDWGKWVVPIVALAVVGLAARDVINASRKARSA